MSLWLDSYMGYSCDSNFITIEDGYDENIKKMKHMLVHLSMPVFLHINYETRLEFLIEAKEQFNKIKELDLIFSIDQLFALPFIYNKIEKLDVHKIYDETKCIIEKQPDIQKKAANDYKSSDEK
jgi:hypothetical protein